MVILHLAAPADVGGLERVVQALAIGQRESGHTVHVAAIVPNLEGAQAFLRPMAAAGVRTHTVLVAGRAYARERAAVAVLCRALRPDVVHTHGYRPDVVDAGVARRLGIATVTTVHGFTGGGWKNRLYEWVQRRAFRSFDAVVAVSAPLAERLGGVPASRLVVLPNAWREPLPALDRAAARAQLGVADDTLHLGWVGRLSLEKGPDVFVEALARIKDLRFVASFLGDGPEQGRLRARGAEIGVSDRLRWHGATADASRLFPGFDLFVLSSRTEGTPIVLFEAMSAGVPIVATRVGGVGDVVTAAEALLVASEDPEALAGAIRTVANDRVAAVARARAARARVEERYALGPWVAGYDAIYERVRGHSR
jgi:glycosyltransferase involved in cell wall biosynthesis